MTPPLALYVHLPWCVQKCPYCDFNSHALREVLPEAAYRDALLADLALERAAVADDRAITSVFFGGGTPSLFAPEAIGAVLEAADSAFGLAPDCEITLEANPGTVDAGHFRGYRDAGVNRLSIGVQSFDDAKLAALGRIHDADAARRAVETARAAGFDNLNLDLMFALPGQDRAGAEADLRAAIALEPEHISWYHLTLEPNTAFAAAPPALPDEDAAAEMMDAGTAILQAAGFASYETSAWARPGRQCRHNRNYWSFGDYLGIGAGAHGKISRRGESGELIVERRVRQRHPRRYLAAAGSEAALAQREPVARSARGFEFAMNALRLRDGFDWATLAAHTDLEQADLAAPLQAATARGLVTVGAGGVRPTALGRAHLNTLLGLFL
ncbi:radical SAM family heme chaperone HemW [Algiphilus aromaticivorans]|uniref:radical SAM family heme chaperone HemW n=1 Tax=Algiphilus aromaticivorans TaxID=382454 RepID=UPI0005C131F4|nr:radical SAM family heme chaperone HemW [Algiphilus aromaticivorans]